MTSFSLFFVLGDNIVKAQSITIDQSTNTNIQQTPNQYDISGGESAGNNIFHSFEKFGLTQGEIANFLSGLETKNIFGRVTGGEASFINGLLKITGGTPNLFFINPAGIIFGENSSINVSASFSASTANGIQIGDSWFDALGNNNYPNLFGEPSGFAFLGSELGSIINLGDINVGVTEDLSLNDDGLIDGSGNVIFGAPTQNPGETINLVGGLVINAGTLKTPGGTINIVAIREQQLVRITPEGSLLSIVLPTETETILQPGIDSTSVTPPSLPELLTGGGLAEATAIAVVDGVVRLTGSDTEIPNEIGTNIVSGNIDTFNNLGDGGNININGAKVGVIQGNIDASGNNGGSISISSEGVGIEPFSNSSRILLDSNSFIAAAGIGIFESLEDFPTPGIGGTIRINSNGAIAFATESADFTTSIQNIDVGGINGTLELKAQNNIVTINNDNALDFYLESLPNYLNLNSIDNITLESNDIQIVGANSNFGTTAFVNEDINLNNLLATETIPVATTVIPIDNLTTVNNVIVEASNNLVVERDILVNNNPQFIGSLLEPENIDSAQGIPLEDIPIFQNLTLRVDPAAGEISLLDIRGSFAVTNELLLENTNGNIVIEPQLPQFIDFTSGENIEYRGSNGSLFVGLNSLLFGVEPHGDLRNNLGSVTIDARQGSVELLRGITLNADTDLNIATQRFIGSGTTTLLGNGPNGEPGRIDSELVQTYTIGVISFGGESLDATGGQPIFDETGEVQLSEEGVGDPEPGLQLVVGFNPDNPNLIQPQPIVLAGDESTDASGNIEILLLSDQNLEIGEFDPSNESGIAAISKISRISTNGSLVGSIVPIAEISLGSEVISSETPVVTETPAVTDTHNEPESEIIPDISGLELEILAGSIAKSGNSSNMQSQQQLASSNEEISLEIGSDSQVATGAGQSASNTESVTEQSATGESAAVTTSSSSSDSNETESNNNSADQTSNSTATQANSDISNQSHNNSVNQIGSNIANQTDNNSASRRGIDSNWQSQQQSITINSSSTSSNATESNNNSANQTSNNVTNQTNSNTANQANSNTASQTSSDATNQANSNAASEASDAANQANSNAASEASDAANQANSNAASEAIDAANQANSSDANLPASKTSPLPENHLDRLSQLEDNSTVALLPEETEVNPHSNPIKHWALPIAGGLLLTGGVGTLIANAVFGNSLSALISNILNFLASNSTLKSEPNNSQSKSEQENPQQDSEIEMETTIESGIMQLSEFPLLDLEISLELEPDSGTKKIYIKDNLVDHDQVKIKPE